MYQKVMVYGMNVNDVISVSGVDVECVNRMD